MLEDDYMGMVTVTLMHAMRKSALMDYIDKLRSFYEQWHVCQLLSPHGHPWISIIPRGFGR